MSTVQGLKEQAVRAAEDAREIKDKVDAETRSMTNEEAEEFDRLTNRAEQLEREAKRQERLEAIETRLKTPDAPKTKPEMAVTSVEGYARAKDPFSFTSELRAFKGDNARANAYQTGQWLKATLLGDARAKQWCNDHNVEMRVQTEAVNTAGGFVVPTILESAVIDLRETYGSMRQWCRTSPMVSDNSIVARRSSGVTAYFIGETDSITESDKGWTNVELTAKKLGALIRTSSELAEDAIINVADDIANEIAWAFAQKEDVTGVDGDGTSTYGGMTGIRTKMIDTDHDFSYWDGVSACDDWAEVDIDDLTGMMSVLPGYALPNAAWYCSAAAKAGAFDRLAVIAGGSTPQDMAEGGQAKFMGYPIKIGPAMPSETTGAALNLKIMLLFGDMSLSSTFGDRRGMTLKVSTDRYLEYDQIGIMATERFCIVHHDIGDDATTRGPIIGLRGNT